MSSALRRFGILDCIACGEPREFVSYDPAVKHITDAFCSECGHIYGRKNDVEYTPPPITGDPKARPMKVHVQKDVPVISDAEAALALARLQARHPGKADAAAAAWLRERAPPEPVAPVPATPVTEEPEPAKPTRTEPQDDLRNVEDDGSRRAAFLRSLSTQWPSPKPP